MGQAVLFPRLRLIRLFCCLLMVILCGQMPAPAQAADYPPAESGMIADLNPGSADLEIKEYLQAASLYYFTSGADLWVTDGSAGGTVSLFHTTASQPAIDLLATDGNRLYFSVWEVVDSDWTFILYVTDGTQASTALIKHFTQEYDTFPLSTSRVVVAGKLFLFLYHANLSNPFQSTEELWVSGGTTTNTLMLASVSNHAQFLYLSAGASRVYAISGIPDTVFGNVPFDSSNTLWATDGTPGGTRALKTGFCRYDDRYPGVSGDLI